MGVDHSRVATSKTWGRGRGGRVIFQEATGHLRKLSDKKIQFKLFEVRKKRKMSSHSPDSDLIFFASALLVPLDKDAKW